MLPFSDLGLREDPADHRELPGVHVEVWVSRFEPLDGGLEEGADVLLVEGVEGIRAAGEAQQGVRQALSPDSFCSEFSGTR